MRFYTGSYTCLGGPGVGVCRWEGGRLWLLGTYRDIDDPIYVTLSGDSRALYAVGGLPGTDRGAAASYRVEGDRLRLLSCRETAGRVPCHQTESPDGRFLYVANYLSGSVSVFPAQSGTLGERIQLVEHTGSGPNPDRQEAPHAHQCVFRPGTNELFVCDLGSDRVRIYDQDPETGLLSRGREIVMPAGMGPRHLVFADADRFYVTGELDNMVRRVVQRGGWKVDGALSTLPPDFSGGSTTAAIRLHDGALWVSNRGHDSLCRIDLDSEGRMLGASWIATGGRTPRDFAFAPAGLLVAHQDGGGVTASDGASMPMDGVVCVCPAP